MKKFLLLSFAIVLQFSAIHAQARGGGTDGGGNVIYISGQPILLDLYVANMGAQDSTPGFPLKTRRSRIADVDFLVASDQTEVMAVLNERLARWGQSPIVEQIRKAFPAAEFWATRGIHVPHEDRYFIPQALVSSIQEKDLKTVAAYSYGSRGGAIFDTSIYNKMALDSQVGLWVHEALRTIQHAESELDGPSENSESLSDETLQVLTTKIVVGPSSAVDRLENTPHLGWLLSGIINLKTKWPQTFKSDCSKAIDVLQRVSTAPGNDFAKTDLAAVTSFCQSPSQDAWKDLLKLAQLTIDAYSNMLVANPQSPKGSDLYSLEIETQADALAADNDAVTAGAVDLMKIQWELDPVPGSKTPRIFLIDFPATQ